MTDPARHIARRLLPAFLTLLLATGCASFRSPVPAAAPAGQRAAIEATRVGFNAVYEGELKIWWYSWQTIWYVAVAPGATGLSVAVLSPAGIKIMQMHGARTQPVCEISMPAANRLKPYGEALWTGLLWSVADDVAADATQWFREGEALEGEAARDGMRMGYGADAINGALLDKQVRSGRRWLYDVQFADERKDGERAYPGWIRIVCKSPRCRLTLRLKSLRWNDRSEGSNDATRP